MHEKKAYTPFPPAPTPSKIDLQLESGEYFLTESQREAKKKAEKKALAKERSAAKKQEQMDEFIPPAESDDRDTNRDAEGKKKKRKSVGFADESDDREGGVYEGISKEKKKKSKHV